MTLIKVLDPKKVLTDTLLISQLEKQGVYQDEVSFVQDYAMPSEKGCKREKGKSPYAKFYQHLSSAKRFMVSSGLPMCDYKGQLLDVGFIPDTGGYRSKTNIFDSFVTLDGQVTAGCLNDQPDGRKVGQIARWSPILYLNGKEVRAGKASLLDEDVANPAYVNNVLEWDYGICKRRIRLIEGHTLGSWVFPTNPNGEVKISYNQSGDFLVKLGMYATDKNTEIISREIFDSAEYPFEVGDSQTFYPDAHAETSSVDGYAGYAGYSVPSTWANLVAAAGNAAQDDATTIYTYRFNSYTTQWTLLYRSIFLFDTSGLDDAATITGAVLSIRGQGKVDQLGVTPDINIYSSAPASNTALAAGDFDSLGTTAFSTAITYNGWETNNYNDFTLNAAGLAAIPVDGVAKFGARNASYDVSGTEPSWSASKGAYLTNYSSEQGAGYKPKLVVTYTMPRVAGKKNYSNSVSLIRNGAI